jgi:RNA polymerase sigma-70 factor (ECF subfamily)
MTDAAFDWFRRGFWEAVGRQAEPVDDALADILRCAVQAWPQLEVAPAVFGRHLGQRVDAGAPLDPQLRRIAADDLYLACACAGGDSRAIALLEQTYASEIRSVLSRVRHGHLLRDDFRQILRRKLFVGIEDKPAAIVRYGGQGALRAWIRVTALRTALNAARDANGESPTASEDLFDFETSPEDPELDHLKRTYRDAFREAFEQTLQQLPARERNLLRQSVLHGLSVREIARLYDVHHATVARWIAGARQHLLLGTRTVLERRLGVNSTELDSIMGLIESRLDVSVSRALGRE